MIDSYSSDAPYVVGWIRGSTLKAGFEISVRANETTSALERRIRETRSGLGDGAIEDIRLYMIPGDEAEVRESLGKMGDGKLLDGHTLLYHFLGVPVLDPLHIIVEFIASPQSETLVTFWHFAHRTTQKGSKRRVLTNQPAPLHVTNASILKILSKQTNASDTRLRRARFKLHR